MIKNTKYYKCNICGSIINVIEDTGRKPFCCENEMTLLFVNVTDASPEIHIPEISIQNKKLIVKVGSQAHPMTEEHHICWISVEQRNRLTQVKLDKDEKPCAAFYVKPKSPLIVYAYCNLHGLWASEVKDDIIFEGICSAEFTEGCK